MSDKLRQVLRDHFLAGIHCDHEKRTDKASCACSLVNLPERETVGAAVEEWIEHVVQHLETR